ncbi:protein-glutamine gamma-glutamyltransferase [Wukongibacter sp. M2B1]|uniref:protein-glutamine gamma-glutamyltransferase n=1 Tax=Wukongibacter sp. M2B1 TaxID=3088895 RepID=UPI003D7921F6
MIKISGEIIDPNTIISAYPPNSIEIEILNTLTSSEEVYVYDSIDQLKFELNMRSSIIKASRDLNESSFSFKIFRKSICNPKYWNRTDEGGFLLKEGVKPSDGIKDIYTNSSLYGTECATAMVIVFYKALVDIYPEELFNKMFPNIHLMNWHYIDRDLDIGYYENLDDYLPGDCRYFKNPDVDPLTPEWQGENVIDLGDGTYYGHGVGIETGEEIIDVLNYFRIENSSTSAYLLDSATRPNFKYLYNRYLKFNTRIEFSSYRLPRRYDNRIAAIYC